MSTALADYDRDRLASRILYKINPYLGNNPEYIDIIKKNLINCELKYDASKGASFASFRKRAIDFSIKRILLLNKKFLAEQSRFSQVHDNMKGNIPDAPSLAIMGENDIAKKKLIDEILSEDKLTNTEKKYLQQYFIEGKTQCEIADECDVSRQAVSFSIINAINKLKEIYGTATANAEE